MIPKWLAGTIAIFFLQLIATIPGRAQPLLPDLLAKVQRTSVLLQWQCQYNGVQSIAVLRSADSLQGFVEIGTVKKLAKGGQEYRDERPLAGINFYKLKIKFQSGLGWSSNFVRAVAIGSTPTVPNSSTEATAGRWLESSGGGAISVNGQMPTKMVTSPDEPLTSLNILPRYVFIHPPSGHVLLRLPADVNSHVYTIRFYTLQGRMVFEVPSVSKPEIIFDKRNFQRKGTYKYTIRKDFLELESGSISIN